MTQLLNEHIQLTYDFDHHRRWIAGRESIIHCHHYNSRLQSAIEDAVAVDGKSIFVSTAEAVFAKQLVELLEPQQNQAEKWAIAGQLYSYLGYGKLDFSDIARDVVTSPCSHFVEGWIAGFPSRSEPVCSLTQGYLQGAYAAITGKLVTVRESSCQISGAEQCTFTIDHSRTSPLATYDKSQVAIDITPKTHGVESPIDEPKIIQALAEMPIEGDSDGLIPAFNVYLANTPADFYNLVAIRFVEAMEAHHLGDVARTQLQYVAENCGLNTFRGIRASAEWDSLIGPMVGSPEDELIGMVAVSNALGWGRWDVIDLVPGQSMKLQSANSYESIGYQQLRGRADRPVCPMLTGLSAGLFELVYGEGSLDERFGQFIAYETECCCHHGDACLFEVSKP